MSRFYLVCPLRSGKDKKTCIGSKCAMWVWTDSVEAHEDELAGCCGLACASLQRGMHPTISRDPAVGGDEE